MRFYHINYAAIRRDVHVSHFSGVIWLGGEILKDLNWAQYGHLSLKEVVTESILWAECWLSWTEVSLKSSWWLWSPSNRKLWQPDCPLSWAAGIFSRRRWTPCGMDTAAVKDMLKGFLQKTTCLFVHLWTSTMQITKKVIVVVKK